MEAKRVISKDKGEAIARDHNIKFLETSAKANINIEEAFTQLAEAILQKQMSGRVRKSSQTLHTSQCQGLPVPFIWFKISID